MKKSVLIIVGVILLVAVGLAGLTLKWPTGNNHRIQASGIIEAKEVLVSAEVSGKVNRLGFEEGQKVTAGQILLEIEKTPLLAQFKQAEADLAGAKANLVQSEDDFRRAKKLYQDQIISSDQFQKVATKLAVSRSQAGAASARVDLLKNQLDKATVVAPGAGTVSKKLIEAGEFVSPGLPLVLTVDLNDVWIKVFIPEEQVGLIQLNNPAKVFLDSFPNQSFDGIVSYISEESEFTPKNIQTKKERVRLVFAVKIKVDNKGGQFKPGLPADVEILPR
jgi:HlyD family secretion protein